MANTSEARTPLALVARRILDADGAPRQVAGWDNRAESPDDFYLVRMYAGGVITVERKVDGVYTGEVELQVEAWDFGTSGPVAVS